MFEKSVEAFGVRKYVVAVCVTFPVGLHSMRQGRFSASRCRSSAMGRHGLCNGRDMAFNFKENFRNHGRVIMGVAVDAIRG